MIAIAEDNKHGYSQYERYGPDYDCSSLTIEAAERAGYKVKRHGATYTGNMKQAFIKEGFTDVTKSVDLRTGRGLKRGDVLLSEKYHVEVYIGNGKLVGANSDEVGGIRGAKKGDQTGREIWVKPYFVYRKGWDCVLRPPVEGSSASTTKPGTFTRANAKFIKNERHTGVTQAVCNVRSAPSLSAPIVASYDEGQEINYDSVYEGDGYRWISYVSYSGERRYVAYRRLTGDTKPWIKF